MVPSYVALDGNTVRGYRERSVQLVFVVLGTRGGAQVPEEAASSSSSLCFQQGSCSLLILRAHSCWGS